MDSDTGGTWVHAVSKSVINWPAPASSSYSKRYSMLLLQTSRAYPAVNNVLQEAGNAARI